MNFVRKLYWSIGNAAESQEEQLVEWMRKVRTPEFLRENELFQRMLPAI
jgi:hypothetical protein